MTSSPMVSAYVRIDDDCPIDHNVLGSAEVEFACGTGSDLFEFVIRAEALREFLRVGAEALADMDARFAREQPEE